MASISPVPYFVPKPSRFPIRTGIALLLMVLGAAAWINRAQPGPYLLGCGLFLLALVLIGWFGALIREGPQYNGQVDQSLRWGMAWFIFSEVMFFGGLFAALFYVREVSIPDLSHGASASLWPGYAGGWPASGPLITSELHPMSWKGAPALNTILLLCSGVAITFAGRAIRQGKQGLLSVLLAVTVALGATFLFKQAGEYHHALTDLHLTLSEGAYGATFYLLTGFHGVHVAIGTAMVFVMLVRSLLRQFTPSQHLGLEMVSWYWHFVGVVWLLLYVIVYVL